MIFVLEISVPDRQSLVGSKFYMPPDPSKVSGPYLDLEEENTEDLGEEVQKTNTELEKLKRQLEDIEKQKLRLEELKKRQDELEAGRTEMTDKLTRSLVTVQREAEEAQKRLEQLNSIHNSFTQHLRATLRQSIRRVGARSIYPKSLAKPLAPSRTLASIILRLRPGLRWRHHRKLPPLRPYRAPSNRITVFRKNVDLAIGLSPALPSHSPFKLSA